MSEFMPDAELVMVLEDGEGYGSVANNLTTTADGYVLDARQGKVLDDKKLDKTAVANNLTTIGEGRALDARQGKWLNENKVGFSDIANDLVTSDVNKVLSSAQGVALNNLKLDKTATAADASKLGGKLPEEYMSATGTAADASKLGGKPPEYYLQPRNLLDNSDFRNPVNQRGNTGYTGAVQTIDRWFFNISEGTLTINNSYITITALLYQRFVKSLLKEGTVYTICGQTNDENIHCQTFTFGASYGDVHGQKFGYEYKSGQEFSAIYLKEGSWRWVALYEGSYTDETLPPYVPKGYAAELLECQRYFFPLDRGCICFGSVNKWGSTFYGTIYTPVSMRTKPSISTTSNNYSLTNNGTQVDLTSTLTVQQMNGNNVQIMMDVTNKGMGAAMVTKLWITADQASAYLSADL